MWKGTSKSGKAVTLLNPQEKRNKFFKELKQGFKHTNDGQFKLDDNRKGIKLTDKEKSYRAGYIAAQNDSAKAYKATHEDKKRERAWKY